VLVFLTNSSTESAREHYLRSTTVMERLQRRQRRRKRYADLMIAAIVAAGQHILVTRNQADFRDVLPRTQLANWIDDPPEASLP
jgi:predicted nucleic acid-binding protein